MKFLITGGAGFIGSNYLHYVIDKYPSDFFVCLDCLTYAGNYENIIDLEKKSNYKFIKADIRDNKLIDEIFIKEKFDYVINFAAESHVDNSISNPILFAETNIIGTLNLLNACNKMKKIHPITRYHQISTDEVYGDLPLDNLNNCFDENSPINPSSPYSASKASADFEVLAFARTFKLPVSISRCSNNFGPYQFPEKLIPLVIGKALKNESIPIYGSGENVRDWIYVYDHNVAIDLIVRNGKNGSIYNIGNNCEMTNLDVVKFILKQLNKPEKLITFVQDRPGHDLRYALNSSKIRNELKWKCKYCFKDGMKKTIDWYISNYEWFNNIKNKKYRILYIKKHAKLVPLKECINNDLYTMYQDIPKEELGVVNKLFGVSYKDFEQICEEMIKEETLSNEEIQATTKRFILFINSIPIGEVGIRTTLNDFWINRGSQIYYKIRKSERGKGYGNLILELALKEAKKLGFTKVRINCDNNNIPSKKVIINNGGKVDIKDYKTKDGFSSSYIIDIK